MQPEVIYLDDNQELREIIPEVIQSSLDVRCTSFGNLSDLKSSFTDSASCQVAILDMDLGPNEPTGIDAFFWLRENGFRGEVFFLTGHGRSHPLALKAEALGARTLEKPLGAQRIVQLVQQSLPSTSKHRVTE